MGLAWLGTAWEASAARQREEAGGGQQAHARGLLSCKAELLLPACARAAASSMPELAARAPMPPPTCASEAEEEPAVGYRTWPMPADPAQSMKRIGGLGVRGCASPQQRGVRGQLQADAARRRGSDGGRGSSSSRDSSGSRTQQQKDAACMSEGKRQQDRGKCSAPSPFRLSSRSCLWNTSFTSPLALYSANLDQLVVTMPAAQQRHKHEVQGRAAGGVGREAGAQGRQAADCVRRWPAHGTPARLAAAAAGAAGTADERPRGGGRGHTHLSPGRGAAA